MARLPEPEYRPPGKHRTGWTSILAATPAFQLAQALEQVEQHRRSQRWFERALRRGTEGAAVGLGESLLRGGPDDTVRIEHVGIKVAPAGDPHAAQSVFDAASLSPRILSGRIRSRLASGDVAGAAHLLNDVADPPPMLRALVLEAKATAAGMSDQELALELAGALRAQLKAHPTDTQTRNALIRSQLVVGDIEAARDLAMPLPTTSSTHTLVDWTELSRAGDFVGAHHLKSEAARSSARHPPSWTAPVGAFVVHAQATNYAFGSAAALDAVIKRWPFAATRHERLIQHRLEADLRLLLGDPEPLQALRQSATTPNTAAEAAFRSAVAGQRVLVVGPAPNDRPTPEAIERADVVVSTRQPPSDVLTEQVEVVYVADETFRRDEAFYARSLDQHARRLLVVRPSIATQLRPALTEHPRVRMMQFEDLTPFLGTHFGVQRILYDLVASGAGTIELSGVDFFLGPVTHLAGYGDVAVEPAAGFNHSHDHAYDFAYTQALLDIDEFSPSAAVESALGLSIPAYLLRLRANAVE
jgi:hypothetical protein